MVLGEMEKIGKQDYKMLDIIIMKFKQQLITNYPENLQVQIKNQTKLLLMKL